MNFSPHYFVGLIDHTLLRANATIEDVERLCDEALNFDFAAVCVYPKHVHCCAKLLSGSPIGICTVVGFPFGVSSTEGKVATVKQSLRDGATEFDMVMNLGAFKNNDLAAVKSDIEAVVASAESNIVKVIIEACLLTQNEKVTAAKVIHDSGAHFVKTSTGFSTGGATLPDVKLLRDTLGGDLGVKASGGIKEFKFAQSLVEAGADRIGTSASISIIQGGQQLVEVSALTNQ